MNECVGVRCENKSEHTPKEIFSFRLPIGAAADEFFMRIDFRFPSN